MRLHGKSALIVGASGKDNIGQAIARRFVAEGARVMVAGRREQPLAEFAAEIGALYKTCDIEQPGAAKALAKAAVSALGKLDIAVNSVGGGKVGPFLEVSRSDLEYMTRLQFIAPFELLQAYLGVAADGGAFINISSVGALRVIEEQAAYTSTKAGFDHVVRCVANEFGHRGIRINSLSPGLTDTPLSRDLLKYPSFVEAFTRYYPLGRLGTREEIAAAATFLASDECFMTGENLQVNGGSTLRQLPTAAEMKEAFEGIG